MAAHPSVVVWGFDTSNNIKVRIALGYKGIDYEFRTIAPREREEIVKISGQHLTPVLQHDGRVLFDSAAILRYLDANFRDTPKLYGDTMAEQWAIEDEELAARTRLAGPMMEVIHGTVGGQPVDAAGKQRCAEEFGAAATALAQRLGDRPWLVGDRMTAADITAAAVMFRIRKAELFPVPDAGSAFVDWEQRVMALDGVCRQG